MAARGKKRGKNDGVVVPPERDGLDPDQVMRRMARLAALPSWKVAEIIQRQIDASTLMANDLAIDCLETLRDENAPLKNKKKSIALLSGLGMFTDSLSKQRLAMLRQNEVLPPPPPQDDPKLLMPPELNDEEWEEKYGGTLGFLAETTKQ